MMWQIRQALPWSRIEDPLLRVAFKCANTNAHLYARQWSADEAKILYVMLKTSVFEDLNNLDTKFTLIHNVWTTKGNSAPFGSEDDPLETLWASPCSADCNSPQEEELVSQDKRYTFLHIIWKEILVMLTFKWSFFYMLAQTTDSGLNNNTMASMMYELLHDTPDGHAQSTMWDPTCMHIRCFCHKLALIVNVGLAALSLKTLPPGKMKQSVLGRLTEEAEPVESTSALPDIKILSSEVHKSDSTDTTVDSASDYGNADDEISDCGRDSESEEADTPTSSIPTQHQKSVRLQELCTKLDGVIKGITRHQKAINARAVIDQILLNAQEESNPGVFGDVCFLPREWKEIDNLNRELEVFVKLTSHMEGDQSMGAHVIPKYLELKESLAIKLQNCWEEDSLYPMHHAMSKRLRSCQGSTIALTQVYPHQAEPQTPQPQSLMGWLASRMKSNVTTQDNEITDYLNANLSFEEGAMNNKATPLQWWKINQSLYPTLAVMARAYLGSVGSLCVVEGLFSAAADVCSSNRGRLLPSTMSHCCKETPDPCALCVSTEFIFLEKLGTAAQNHVSYLMSVTGIGTGNGQNFATISLRYQYGYCTYPSLFL
ncbi:hypothetical protein PSTG_13643 [Puccinia striiformis f. sp. tritici PST-78]|uniref:HAT C-terminal dimerisation domain-containing protein n=1 Tax=Puccinia striiformis f. sp. tritici PST-78 TaxID=1165861 RepID=A0A0L0V0W4_9BASI|nr:hypothetical protein PSTG_13643 [Puccinia striiformis f. sp. tritici PST-78]